MKLYYIEYEDAGGEVRVEAFKSKTLAQKRINAMTKEYKRINKLWQEYVITNRNKPTEKPVEPPAIIYEAGFDLNAEGVMKAFLHYHDRRFNYGSNRRS
jgi:hypothetical protein